MNGPKITRIVKMMLLVGLCALGAILPQAKADAENQKITFTFTGPVEVPGKVLDAGTYVFKILDLMGDRDVIQISNKRGDKVYGTFITIPNLRMKPTGKTVITFEERATGSPEAVRAWFYPGFDYGHEFVYPKARAVQLAKANNTPVASVPDELAANSTRAALKQAPLKAQRPTGEEVEVAEVFEPPPPTAASLPRKLPKTASELPLIGLIGLLSLGMAGSLRFATARTK
jgi:hypothetical protein